jgi:membrane-associated phospholipid phosphatase
MRWGIVLALRVSESIAFTYFLYLAIVCWLRPLSNRRRFEIAGVSIAMLILIRFVATHASTVVRDWAPGAYILPGYYLPGRFYERPSTRIETWLVDWDRRVLGDPTTRFARWPRLLIAYLDVVYMGCFLMLPGGMLALVLTGHAESADRYWTLVGGADFAAFVSLAIFQTRPPWVLERPPALQAPAVHHAALAFVRHGTIGANTFPSGHTAVSFAIAYALLPVVPIAGAVALVLSVTIAVACIVGRYHYVIDVWTGVLLSLAVWTVVWVTQT